MPKAKKVSQKKKTVSTKAKPKKKLNAYAKLLEMKKAQASEQAAGGSTRAVWTQTAQPLHTLDHRFRKFAGPRRRAS